MVGESHESVGPSQPMDVVRIAELADRYGAELAHWPRREAAEAQALLAVSVEARAVLVRAHRLDRVLSQTRTRSASVNLREQLLMAAPGGGWREAAAVLWPFGPVWRPAMALFSMALFGVFLGSTEAASWVVPVSVNAALSEEVRVMVVSASDVLGDSNPWQE